MAEKKRNMMNCLLSKDMCNQCSFACTNKFIYILTLFVTNFSDIEVNLKIFCFDCKQSDELDI